MRQAQPNPEQAIMQFILGKWISQPIHLAVKMGIPDMLDKQEMTIEELSQKTCTHKRSLSRLMRALAGVGIFSETSPQVYRQTELSRCLTHNNLKAVCLMFSSYWHERTWRHLEYSIQTGESAFEHIFNQPAFEWLNNHPEALEIYQQANAVKVRSSMGPIIDLYNFSNVQTILDVGGGTGELLSIILNRHPHLKGIVAELEENIPAIQACIRKNGLENRLQAIACDFFKKIPTGIDIIILSNILHDWPDEKAIEILSNCRAAMSGQSRLLILEAIIPDGNLFSIAKLMDLEVLLMGKGCERTENEFIQILEPAGLKVTRIIPSVTGIFLIEAGIE